ncbi:hypothetical protein PIROE2DRAFT_21510 [Piromyces sp. E2]|nr:hypothetical protein PIROE2DRAFT_21510 [Piromyces sp. E2]|eukprot:OUM57331.1 hypothetical protein PIROE2DRAFT_21510 [Piromyces sp. E2]
MTREISLEEMLKKLENDVKLAENFDDDNGRLDIASMNKQMDNTNAILDILESKFDTINANLDAMLSAIESQQAIKEEPEEETKEEEKKE